MRATADAQAGAERIAGERGTAQERGIVARAGNAEARVGSGIVARAGDGAVARARRYEARTNGERVPDRDAEDRSQGVTLEIGGDSGTKFYGTCTVGGQEKFISWRVAARYGYEPGGGKLECEIREGVPAPWRSSSLPGTTYAPCSGPAPVEAL
jgi:hypothetical protein